MPDGSLVLKLYYTRNSYNVTYVYEGTVPTGASELPEKATYKYEEEVMKKFAEIISDYGVIAKEPKMEGRRMNMFLDPKKDK